MIAGSRILTNVISPRAHENPLKHELMHVASTERLGTVEFRNLVGEILDVNLAMELQRNAVGQLRIRQ